MKGRETEPNRLHNISPLNSCQLVHWSSPACEAVAGPACPCSVSSLCFSVSAPRPAAYPADPSFPSPQLSSCWNILGTLGRQNSSQDRPPLQWCWRRTWQWSLISSSSLLILTLTHSLICELKPVSSSLAIYVSRLERRTQVITPTTHNTPFYGKNIIIISKSDCFNFFGGEN